MLDESNNLLYFVFLFLTWGIHMTAVNYDDNLYITETCNCKPIRFELWQLSHVKFTFSIFIPLDGRNFVFFCLIHICISPFPAHFSISTYPIFKSNHVFASSSCVFWGVTVPYTRFQHEVRAALNVMDIFFSLHIAAGNIIT